MLRNQALDISALSLHGDAHLIAWTPRYAYGATARPRRGIFTLREPIEFEWNIFLGRTTLDILHKIQKNLEDRQINQNILKIESSSCQCSMTSIGRTDEFQKSVLGISKRSSITQKRFPLGHSSFLGPGEDKWKRSPNYKPERKWCMTADVMVEYFKESGHPVFRGISTLNRCVMKRKGGRCTIHFSAGSSNIELLFRTIHSANEPSIYGAVVSWCEELAQLTPGQTHLSM